MENGVEHVGTIYECTVPPRQVLEVTSTQPYVVVVPWYYHHQYLTSLYGVDKNLILYSTSTSSPHGLYRTSDYSNLFSDPKRSGLNRPNSTKIGKSYINAF